MSTLALRAMGGGTTQSLARYVRWSVTSASAWSLTFRAWASPNLPSGHDPLVHARQHEIELQPWVTIFGSNKNPPVLQAQNAAIDLENYRDVTVFAEVGTATASSTIEYQTAPTRDERLWQATTGTLALPASGLLTTPIHYDTATCPASRFLRWKLNNTLSASWNVSLRIWVSAKPSGPKPSPELVRHALGQRNLHT